MQWFSKRMPFLGSKAKPPPLAAPPPITNREVLVSSPSPVLKSSAIESSSLSPRTLVLSGGGVKGISFIGCIQNLEQRGLLSNVHNLIGTSFGSLVCYMLALGMSSDDMLSLVFESLGVCMGDEGQQKRPGKSCLYSIISCIESAGFDDGSHLEMCIKRPLIERHERTDISFLEFAKLTGKNLVIIGSNITRATSEQFSLESTPDMSVIRALRVSTSIPLLFEPVVMNNDVYMDGALFKNFALDLVKNIALDNVVGLLIEDDMDAERVSDDKQSLSIIFVARMLIYSMLKRLNRFDVSNDTLPKNVKIVKINSTEMLDRVISKERREKTSSTIAAFYSLDTMSFVLTMEEALAMMKFGFDKMSDLQ
jgi:predicted acylesterase/phospholipase RssA